MSRALSTELPTLAMLLRRGQLRVALAALLAAASVLTVAMLGALRVSQLHGLELIARSVAYTAEAAVVFRDRRAVEDLLAEAQRREGLVEARVVLQAEGRELARRAGTVAHPWLDGMLDRLLPLRAQAPVFYQGEAIARVELRGDSRPLLRALGWAALAVLLGSLFSGLVAWRVTRRLTPLLEAPLRALAAQSRLIRQQRAYGRRAQGASVREIAELAADFNALLDEVQAHQSELLQRQAHLQSDRDSLAQQARHDALTGLANRAHFERCLADAVARAAASGGRLALLFMDADGFKPINDRHGHEAGDRVLVAMAQRLRVAVREHDLVARLGGDEFVALIEPLRQPEDAVRVVQQIERAVRHPVALADGPAAPSVVPGLSIGVALYPEQGDSAEALLRAADAAMYHRKRAGRASAPQGDSVSR